MRRGAACQWLSHPDGQVNQASSAPARGRRGAGPPLYFLCPQRRFVPGLPLQPATSAGYGPAHNVLDSFEGGHDDGSPECVGLEERRIAVGQG